MSFDEYQRNGYFIYRSFLSTVEVRSLQHVSAELLDEAPGSKIFHDEPAIWCWRHKPDGQRSVFPASRSSVIQSIAFDESRHAKYRELSGSDYLQLFEIVMFDKPANIGEAFVWHSDRSYYPVAPGNSISVWIAIDDCDEENGALHFAKGSHRIQGMAAVNVKTGERPENGEGQIPDPESAGLETERVDMAPGDAVFFTSGTWHMSPPNMSASRRRRGIVLRFWLEPNTYAPAPGKSAAFVRQITAQPNQIIKGAPFPVFDYRQTACG